MDLCEGLAGINVVERLGVLIQNYRTGGILLCQRKDILDSEASEPLS